MGHPWWRCLYLEARKRMTNKLTKQFIWSRLIFCLIPLAIVPSQHDTKTRKQAGLITVQMKVTDTQTGSAIDNAEVVIKWAKGQEPHSANATTNSMESRGSTMSPVAR